MAMSTRFVLAIHVLTSLAITDGKPMRSEDLAFSVQTNATFIRSLLSRLQKAGLTTSQLGTGGGALLAKPSAKIRLLDVYRAVEDGEVFAFHRQGPNESCVVGKNIQQAIQSRQITATDLVNATPPTGGRGFGLPGFGGPGRGFFPGRHQDDDGADAPTDTTAPTTTVGS